MTTTSTISIDRDELAAARAVVLAVGPTENDATQGVALVTAGGARRWLAWAGGAIACTAPFSGEGSTGSPVLLSRRMVEFASTLAEEGETIELHLHDGSATVVTDTLNLRFDAPAPRPVPQPIERLDRCGDGCLAWAVVAAGPLFRLLAMGRALPIGVDLDEVDAPQFRLDVTDGELSGSVDWTAAGAPAAAFSTAATTTGSGGTWVSPASAAHVVGFCDADDLVSVTIPVGAGWLEVGCDAWVARIASDMVENGRTETTTVDVDQWRLFDPDDLVDPIHVAGSLRPDPLAGASLTDVRAFAMDPDPQSRMLAAASRWNWDAGIQLTLADDPDLRVVLALLDDVDPGVDAARVVIHGPHVAARRVLAGRNLPSELLVELAGDPDPVTRDSATQTLAGRGHQPEVTR